MGFRGLLEGLLVQLSMEQRVEFLRSGITTKELLPVVVAVALWGRLWCHKHVCVMSDNTGAVAIVTHKDSMVALNMHLLRCLHFFCAHYDIVLQAQQIEGKSNQAADALSRNSLQAFYRVNPGADRRATHIPPAQWEL